MIRNPLFLLVAAAGLVPSIGCDSKKVTAEAPGPLEVRVVDCRSRKPVEGVRVRVEDLDPSGGFAACSELSDSAGLVRFRLPDARRVSVRAVDPLGRYSPRARRSASSGPLLLELRRGVEVSLWVRDPSGEPLSARLIVWAQDGPIDGVLTREGAPGELFAGLLPSGPVKCFVLAPGYRTRVLDVTIPRKGGAIGEIVLVPGGARLQGRIAPDLEVRPDEAYLRFAGAGLSVAIDAAGRFEFRGLPELEGTLVLRRGRRELMTRPVEIRERSIDVGVLRPRS